MINRETQLVVRLEHLIFFYCIVALFSVPKLAIYWDTKAFRLFDWYVNDMSYAFRVIIPFLPILLGCKIDNKIYWDNRLEFISNISNRIFFGILLFSNIITVVMDYLRLNDDYEFDRAIIIPKTFLLFSCLGISWYFIKKQKEE